MLFHEQSITARDGIRLTTRRWLPDGPPAAVVLLLHGATEHGGRYGVLAEALAARGYAAYALDLRGHGRSDGQRFWVDRFDEHVADLDRLAEDAAAQHAGSAMFIFGHSMGGTVALLCAGLRQPAWRGLILSAPGFGARSGPYPVLGGLSRLCDHLCPRLGTLRVRGTRISRHRQVVAEFEEDPLVYHGRIRVHMGAELFRAVRRAEQAAAGVRVPLLVLHGTDDRLVSVAESRRLVAIAPSTDKTLRLYEGLGHNLLHEPDHAHVLADILGWIAERV